MATCASGTRSPEQTEGSGRGMLHSIENKTERGAFIINEGPFPDPLMRVPCIIFGIRRGTLVWRTTPTSNLEL